MNIAFLNSIEKETYGGMEEWIRMVAGGLASREHRVTLIGRPGSKFLERGGKNEKLETLPLEISGDFNPFTLSSLKNYLNENNVDYIVVNFNKDIRLGGLSARWNKSTKVIWSVGLDITKDNLVHKFLTPKLVDRVIVPSHSLKNQITALGYIKSDIVDVIPIGIEDVPGDNADIQSVREKYNIPKNCLIAVTVGRMVDQKGHKFLVEAIPEIIKSHPEIRFLFLGDGPNEPMLKELSLSKQIEKYIVFCGMLDSVTEILNSADMMIHPSREEPFGIAVLEGMRAGLPVAASRIGGIPEVVEENYNALLFKPENPEAIVNAVLSLLDNPVKMIKMGRNGRKRFEEKFKYSDMIDRVEKAVLSV